MFKAIDKQDGRAIIILDHVDDLAIGALREQAHAGRLRCPVCNQPVAVKAGAYRRRHFAHKDLGTCPSSHESPELLQARAVLYEWLKAKFTDGVTLEHRPPDFEHLPRGFDCWVETPKGHSLAYWLVEGRLSYPHRQMLAEIVDGKQVHLNPMFLSQVMQRNVTEQGILNLTPTEREFLRPSLLDRMYDQGRSGPGTIHYLDADAALLVTFRAMRCIESPQQYSGHELSAPLAQVQVRPSNGEFVHPGEWERLEQFRAAEEARQAQMEAEAEKLERQRAELREMLAKRRTSSGYVTGILSKMAPSAPSPALSEDREGTCIYCGRRTREWWSYDGKTGQCKCNACRDKGARRT